MNSIHPLACVHPDAKLGDNNTIGPFCIIGEKAVIGDNNTFHGHVCIGTPAQHRTAPSVGGVRIGNGNVFHEFSQVHCSLFPLMPTIVGNNGYFMKGAHVAHCCVIEDDVTMCNDATLGGRTYVMCGANLGFLCIVHQGQVIGSYSMLGMGTVVPKGAEILPGEIYAGNPVRHLKPNLIGRQRHGVTALQLKDEHDRFRTFKHAW